MTEKITQHILYQQQKVEKLLENSLYDIKSQDPEERVLFGEAFEIHCDHCEPLLCQTSSQIWGYSVNEILSCPECPMWAKGRGNRIPGRWQGMNTGQ